MLRVTIEILPSGDESRKRHLGTVEIANDGTGSQEIGNYSIRLAKFGRPNQTWLYGKLSGFDRIRRGPYDLLLQSLLATIGVRNSATVEEYKKSQSPIVNLMSEEM
ncbi:hypothetical protein ACO0LG_05015 [Undibacterium sp. Ji42W]